ncbi:MAG: efflux pump, inner rane subunit [Acidobacteria bacterium]|nr:efflux pump, inner rane subunit [Acidobacteriota bacterium]
MFWRLVRESLWRPRNRRRGAWAVLAVALGTAVAAAMLNVSLDVGDKVGRELRALGANVVVTPAADSLPVEIGGIDFRPVTEGAYISEASLGSLKEIFWRNNIIAFAPFLYVPAQLIAAADLPSSRQEYSTTLVGTWFDRPFTTPSGDRFQTGVRPLNPTWAVEGNWIDDSVPSPGEPQVMLGRSLAEAMRIRAGDSVTLAVSPKGAVTQKEVAATVAGIITTGGAEDRQVFASLPFVQSLASLPDEVRTVRISALTKPEDDFSRRDPKTMTRKEYDLWYCSPYISSILHQITEALPSTAARAVRPVAETQGNVLGKMTFLMGMLAILALMAAALSISSLASLAVAERQQEIALMKAVGAQDWLVSGLFLAEAAVHGLAGGALGFLAGQGLARVLGSVVFGSEIAVNWLLLPIMVMVALAVTFAGTWLPLRRAARFEPAVVLRGE